MRPEAVLLIASAAVAHPSLHRIQRNEGFPTTGSLYHSQPVPRISFHPNPVSALLRKRRFDEDTAILSAASKIQNFSNEGDVMETLQDAKYTPGECICRTGPENPMFPVINPCSPVEGKCNPGGPEGNPCVIL
jgi:hypothetical protein